MLLDSRSFAKPVYKALKNLRGDLAKDDQIVKQQKSQAVQLYTYLSTWGLMRLKAEEKALNKTKGKQAVVESFFKCLQKIWGDSKNTLSGEGGLDNLSGLSPDEYLGLTGLGLRIAQEYSFWATAIYHDVSGED